MVKYLPLIEQTHLLESYKYLIQYVHTTLIYFTGTVKHMSVVCTWLIVEYTIRLHLGQYHYKPIITQYDTNIHVNMIPNKNHFLQPKL